VLARDRPAGELRKRLETGEAAPNEIVAAKSAKQMRLTACKPEMKGTPTFLTF
jgi:hypothetical protein